MRIMLLLFLCGPAWAQVTVGETIKDGILQVVEDDCDTEIRRGLVNTKRALSQARVEWDHAFHYIDQAFYSLVRAEDFCASDPIRLGKVQTYLKDYSRILNQLVCSFHTHEAYGRFQRGELAIEHFDDWKSALFHTNWATYHIEEAIKRCKDPERVELLFSVQDDMYRTINIITETIKLKDGH